jgi:hypothetical protein
MNMSAHKIVLIFSALLMVSGCAIQPMGSGNPSASGSSMPSGPQMPPASSGSPSSPGSSSSQGSSSSSSSSQGSSSSSQSSGSTNASESSSGEAGQSEEEGPVPIVFDASGASQGEEVFEEPKEVWEEPPDDYGTLPGSTSKSVFEKSLEVFDQEIAEERIVIAASNQGTTGMTSQEMADRESIIEGTLEGFDEVFSSGVTKEGDNDGDSTDELTKEQLGRTPECVLNNESAEDKIARQLRVFAMKEDDPVIRDAIWEQYLRHMGMSGSKIEECLKN